jgi:hypothetical protein
MATFSLLPRPRQILRRACSGWVRGGRAWDVTGDFPERRGKGMGEEWRAEERWGRSRGFYLLATARSMVHFDGSDWRVWAVRWGRRCGLNSVAWSRSSGACCANGQTHGFSQRATFSLHGQKVQEGERVRRGWHVAGASMPCCVTCSAWRIGRGMLRNGNADLGVQYVHEKGQNAS